jgi:hypothetical protein
MNTPTHIFENGLTVLTVILVTMGFGTSDRTEQHPSVATWAVAACRWRLVETPSVSIDRTAGYRGGLYVPSTRLLPCTNGSQLKLKNAPLTRPGPPAAPGPCRPPAGLKEPAQRVSANA